MITPDNMTDDDIKIPTEAGVTNGNSSNSNVPNKRTYFTVADNECENEIMMLNIGGTSNMTAMATIQKISVLFPLDKPHLTQVIVTCCHQSKHNIKVLNAQIALKCKYEERKWIILLELRILLQT